MININIYTIGFTKKSAADFFELLKRNQIKLVLDIRLNNSNQLAGFSKGRDLEYFLREITDISYIHDIRFAPTKYILDNYKKKNIDWNEYTAKFNQLLLERNIASILEKEYIKKLDGICLLCSEADYKFCHRSIVADFIMRNIKNEDINIINL